jgi:hypothetical protein
MQKEFTASGHEPWQIILNINAYSKSGKK